MINRDERGHAFAFSVLAADDVAGALGRDHDDVHVLGRDDRLEVDGEPVAEEQRLALTQVRRDVLLVAGGLLGVGQRDHDDVGALHGLGGRDDFEALFAGDRDGLGAFVEADDDVAAAVLEVQRVGVALGAEAEDGEGFVLEHAEVGVFVGVNFSGHIRVASYLTEN